MFAVARHDDALRYRDFVALRDALLGSPLLGATTLNGPFEHSRGFAITFRGAGLERVCARVPQVRPHLDRVLGRPGVRALTPWFRRVGEVPNAWFFNVLVVGEGGAVGRHVDATLRKGSGVPDLVPLVVSVLYLAVPRGEGGELRVFQGDELLGTIAPRENTVVHFRGDLSHDVAPLSGLAPGAARASLVIEQYHLAPDALLRIPEYQLESEAGFAAYLRAHQARPPPTPGKA